MRSALRLLHYSWPVVMGLSLAPVIHRATGAPIDPIGLTVFVSCVAAAYAVDRILDPPQTHSRLVTRLLWLTTAASTVVGSALAWRLPIQTAAILPLFGVVAVGYARLKRIALMKAVVVPLVWTWAAIALPFADGSWFGWRWVETPVAAPVFLLIASGCLLCDLKDAARDHRASVPSVPARLGIVAATGISIALAAGGSAVAAWQGRPSLEIDGLCLALLGASPALVATDVIGPLAVDMILTLPGVLIAAHVI